jgi:glycosyltransferase involved in cell wall biosynthesis
LSSGFGGLETDSIKYAKRLSAITNTFLIVKKNTFLSKKAMQDNSLRTIEISFWKSISLALFFSIKKIIIKNNIKNIIYFGASELKTLYFSLKDLDINFIIRHGTRKGPKNNWYHSLIYSKVDYHIGISKDLTENILQSMPLSDSSKIKTIYPSIIYNKEPNPRILDHQIKILNTGRIVAGKGHIDMINACEVLHDNGINFILNIVGDGDNTYVEKIKNHAKNMSYSDKIIFHGYQSNIPKYLNENDIFLFPSYGEGLSNSFTEALSYGLVCLSYDNTSFSEFTDLGFHTHLAEDTDQSSLAKQLLKIAKNLEDEKSKSMKNIKKAPKIFSYEIELDQYNQILL